MKKVLLLFAAVAAVAFMGCSDDNDTQFKYGDAIYGTWDITHIKNDGKWLDITSSIFSQFHASATFNPDGTYSGHGYFGNGSGTYKAMDNAIICYVGKEEYARYIIHNLTNDTAEMTMKMGGSSIDIKSKKR